MNIGSTTITRINTFLLPVETFAFSLTNKCHHDLNLPVFKNNESLWSSRENKDWEASWYEQEGREIFENFKDFLKSNGALIRACGRYVRFDSYENSFIEHITNDVGQGFNAKLITFFCRPEKYYTLFKKIEKVVPSVPRTVLDWYPKYRNGRIFKSLESEDNFLIRNIRMAWVKNRKAIETETSQLKLAVIKNIVIKICLVAVVALAIASAYKASKH